MAAAEATEVAGWAAIIVAIGGFLTVIGKGIIWAFTAKDKRERLIEESVERHTQALETRLALAEHTIREVSRAFRLVTGEMMRRGHASAVLDEAQTIFENAFKLPVKTPEDMLRMLTELHVRGEN